MRTVGAPMKSILSISPIAFSNFFYAVWWVTMMMGTWSPARVTCWTTEAMLML